MTLLVPILPVVLVVLGVLAFFERRHPWWMILTYVLPYVVIGAWFFA